MQRVTGITVTVAALATILATTDSTNAADLSDRPRRQHFGNAPRRRPIAVRRRHVISPATGPSSSPTRVARSIYAIDVADIGARHVAYRRAHRRRRREDRRRTRHHARPAPDRRHGCASALAVALLLADARPRERRRPGARERDEGRTRRSPCFRSRTSSTRAPTSRGCPARDAKTPWGAPQRSFTVTDLALVDGEVYVAGLGNEEFASTLRRLPYPFKGTGTADDRRDVSHVARQVRDGRADRVVRADRSRRQAIAGRRLWLLADRDGRAGRAGRQEARAREDGRGARRREPSVRHDPLHELEGQGVHPRREQQPHAHAARSGGDRGGEGDDDVGEAGVGAGGRRLPAGRYRRRAAARQLQRRQTS